MRFYLIACVHYWYEFIKIIFLDKNGADLCLSIYASFDLPKIEGETNMSLSIAWSCPDENGLQSIAFSDSQGYISVVHLNDLLVCSFKAHSFEAWIVAFNHTEPNILYTGIGCLFILGT